MLLNALNCLEDEMLLDVDEEVSQRDEGFDDCCWFWKL